MTDNPTNDELKQPRRMNGVLLFGALFLVIFALTYQPTVDTIVCDETTLNPEPDVIVLGAWWCTYCYKARKYLQHNEITYCEYDMERSEEGKRLYKEVNGKAIPILLIGDYQINGFNERSIEAALKQLHSQ